MLMNTPLFFVLLFVALTSFGKAHETLSQVQKNIEQPTRWAVKLVDGTHGPSIGEKFGLQHLQEHTSHENVHLFSVEGGNLTEFLNSEHVLWHEKQQPRMHFKRSLIPTDPLFDSQWHLHNTPGKDLNVLGAWYKGYTGKGIAVGVVDDGVQSGHPDFAGNYKSQLSWDFNSNDGDPEPYSVDAHGTEAAGSAAAAANSICGVGTAPEASLAGIRLIGDAIDDFTEAAGLSHMIDKIDIFTCSWGPQDDAKRLEGPGTLTEMSIANNIAHGRNGKGTIYAWAGGNGRRSRDNCNYDGYANSRYTIAIGAFDFSGAQSWYSEECAMLVTVAPSSGGARNVYTTDLKGRAGASWDDCSSTFGGTSAASPMAAGVMALILQARPELTWRDMQGVLINAALKIDAQDSDWTNNGAGLSVNHKYGFGRIDASNAVDVARDWQLLPAYKSASCSNKLAYTLSSTNTRVTCQIEMKDMIVEHVELQTEVATAYRGKIRIALISPSGTYSLLSDTRTDNSRNISFDWKWGTIRTWGEKAEGTWTVEISSSSMSTDRLNQMMVTVYGH